jgi:hypothetical protein
VQLLLIARVWRWKVCERRGRMYLFHSIHVTYMKDIPLTVPD